MENQELQIITINITSAGQKVTKNERTKIEHKKIKGIAILSKGGYDTAEVQGLFTLKVNKNAVISDNEIPKFLFEVTHSKSIYESAYKCDILIAASDIEVTYTDGTPALSFSDYDVNFVLICEK